MTKKVFSYVIFLAIAVVLYLLSPWSPTSVSLFTASTKAGCSAEARMPARYTEGEEYLKGGQTAQALSMARQGKSEARDSDEYYRYVVLEAKYYFYIMQADSFLMTQQQLSQYLKRQKKKTPQQQQLEVEAEMQKGVYLTKMVGQMDSAQLHNLRALQLAKTLPCSNDNQLLLLCNIADTYKQMGCYDKSIDYFSQAMELGEAMGGLSPATNVTITTGIASAYSAMRSFEQSNSWWEKAAQLEPQMDKAERFHYLNNRGNDYFLQEKYEESLECFLQLDSLIGGDNDLIWEQMFVCCNLSGVLIKLGQTRRALPYLDRAEQFFTEQNQLIPLYYLTTQRIELAIIEGQLAEALRLDRSNPTPQWMIPEQTMLRQELLIRLYELTGKWQLMASTQHDYYTLKDSIAGDNMQMRLSIILTSSEHNRQMQQQQRQLEQKEAASRWMASMLIVAAVLILLILTISELKRRELKMKGSLMESRIMALRMETVRNRITPHFICNALSAEMMAQAEGRQVDLDGIVELLHRGVEVTGNEVSRLTDELQFIDFYCNVESRSVGPDFHYEVQLAPDVDADAILLPSMSVQIMVENGIKHGLKRKKPQPGCQRSIIVKATRQQHTTVIEVLDNGVGLPADNHFSERTGLRVLRQTFELLNEQNRQEMQFGLENRYDNGQIAGCRAWILLPDDYNYKLKA